MSTKKKILAALSQPMDKACLMDVVGLKDSTVRARLSELTFAGYVCKDDDGRFYTTPSGQFKLDMDQ